MILLILVFRRNGCRRVLPCFDLILKTLCFLGRSKLDSSLVTLRILDPIDPDLTYLASVCGTHNIAGSECKVSGLIESTL